MLLQRLARPPAFRSRLAATRRPPTMQRRQAFFPPELSDDKVLDAKYPDLKRLSDAKDPNMNGGYINPPRIKRQFRDPYADWDDPHERRNFDEPLHENNIMLTMFAPYEYTWSSAGPGLIMIGTFVTVLFSLVGVIHLKYPDRKAYPREFEGGLQRELGGPGATRARMPGDPDP